MIRPCAEVSGGYTSRAVPGSARYASRILAATVGFTEHGDLYKNRGSSSAAQILASTFRPPNAARAHRHRISRNDERFDKLEPPSGTATRYSFRRRRHGLGVRACIVVSGLKNTVSLSDKLSDLVVTYEFNVLNIPLAYLKLYIPI